MIDKGYIDTCILAAYYCPEPSSEDAEKLLLKVKEPVISLLTEVELFSVISKKNRNGELTKRNAQQIINNYTSHLKDGYYHKLSLKAEYYFNASNLLSSLNCTLHTLDALHLMIAISEKLPLITADKKFANAALKIQAQVFTL